jgi:hypothetical protein
VSLHGVDGEQGKITQPHPVAQLLQRKDLAIMGAKKDGIIAKRGGMIMFVCPKRLEIEQNGRIIRQHIEGLVGMENKSVYVGEGEPC